MPKTTVARASPPPKTVLDLVRRFAQHQETYKQQGYNETQVRREFIDPLFEALGWDVDNRAGHAEAYKDVIHEDAIKIGGSTKAPDYCFRIGGVRKFFVEAKKPAVPVKDDPGPAYQLRRYAWTAKLPLAIVTDFEEFAVYDCRIRPKPTDKPSVARVKYITYDEYAERWGEIAAIFSKEAILQGSFDKYAESNRRKRGTAEVDTEFLKEIERWRELLARNIALRNSDLSVRDLNYAVSKTIDRLIFLRMCEDRGVETYAQLLALVNGPRVYERLVAVFRNADDRYNSGLFYFREEKDRADSPDELTPNLIIDDGVLKDIIKGLYYPECPYEFSVLPAEILGQVYEQFLGKVIRLTKGHRAVVEEKPEVRKAGGVYYTPTYIVDYIVKHTVAKLLEGRTVKWIARDKRKKANTPRLDRPLRVLDPACGSGSFLLGAYECLLRWYVDFYTTNDPASWAKRKNPPIHEVSSPAPSTKPNQGRKEAAHDPNQSRKEPVRYRLTIAERKRILLDHIHGVDIDAQAVEVTKLSLLLKVLEGASQQTLDNQLRLFHERALPDLAANIKCGNSLIGPDFYDNQQMDMFDEEERYRINVFDWETEFPHVFDQSPKRKRGVPTPSGAKPVAHALVTDQQPVAHAPGSDPSGGFDAVIGNPPYVDIKALPNGDVRYLFSTYQTANNRVNLFAAFVESSLEIVNASCFRFAMIVPTALLAQSSYRALRHLVVTRYEVSNLARLPNESFGSAAGEVKVDTVIVVIRSRRSEDPVVNIVGYTGYERISEIRPDTAYVHGTIHQNRWSRNPDCVWSINTTDAHELILAKCQRHALPLDDCTEICLGLTPYDKYKGHTPQQIQQRVFHAVDKKDDSFKPLLAGNDVHRYYIHWNEQKWISYGPWLGAPREQRFFTERRILVKQIIDWTAKRIWASITDEELYNTQNAFNLLCKRPYTLDFILGILNSRLMTFYHRKRFLDEFKMRFQKVLIKDCRRFPIRRLELSDGAERSRHDRLVTLLNDGILR